MSFKNARPSDVAEVLPPLPAKSIDFDVLQAALRAGKSGVVAVEAATFKKPELATEPAPSPAPEPIPSTDSEE